MSPLRFTSISPSPPPPPLLVAQYGSVHGGLAALARMPAADDRLFAAHANRVGQVRHAWQVLGVDEWGRASAASPKI